MWAAAAQSAPDNTTIYAVFGFLGVVVSTVGVIVVQWLKSRAERTDASPPGPVDTAVMVELARRQGQLIERADDADNRDHIQDMELRDTRATLDDHHKRITRIERWLNGQAGFLDD